MKLVVRGERVVMPDGVGPASINIHDGRIVRIGAYSERPAGVAELDAGSSVVLPGLVDTHVHLNDPGRSDWEGFDSGTRAAAAGGVTTVVDMPLNSVPATTSAEALDAKIAAASGRCHVDVAFWGGVVPGNAAELEALARGGVVGFKAFLAPSGVEEFEHVAEKDLRGALPVLARLGLPLLVHAEWPGLLREPDPRADPCSYGTWLESRPPESEHEAVDLLIRLAREFDTHIHIVHLASAGALPSLNAARAAGVRVTVETCPHYLTFAADEIGRGATPYKCAPPIRETRNRERLWTALMNGEIDLVATDHSPAPPALKRLEEGDFIRAWGGIASLQIGLSAVWTGAASRQIGIERVAAWLATAPARLAGLHQAKTKGSIAVGCDADLVIWDSDVDATVDASTLYHRHPITPYAGMRLRGRVRATLLRGDVVYREGAFDAECRGRVLRRQC